MSDSIWDDPRITSYVLDELSDEERREFESEMKSETQLAAAVDEARRITERIGDLFQDESTPTLDNKHRQRVFNHAQSLATNATTDATTNATTNDAPIQPADAIHPAPAWGVPLAVVGLAAMLLLMVGITPWLGSKTIQTANVPDDATPRSDVALAQTDPIDRSKIVTEVERFDAKRTDGYSSSQSKEMDPKQKRSESNIANHDAQDNTIPSTASIADVAAVEMIDAEENQGFLLKAQQMVVGESKDENEASSMFALPTATSLGLPEIESLARSSAGLDPSPGLSLDDKFTNDSVSSDDVVASSKMKIAGKVIEKTTPTMAAAPRLDSPPADSSPADSSSANSIDLAAQPMTAQDALLFSDLDQPKKAVTTAARNLERPRENDAPAMALNKPEQMNRSNGAGVAIASSHPSHGRSGASHFDQEMQTLNQRLFGGRAARDRASRIGRARGRSGMDGAGEQVDENPFQRVSEAAEVTIGFDVAKTSYRVTRESLLRKRTLPQPTDVRVEELVNYFDYDRPSPRSDANTPFAANMLVTDCPWNSDHRLARVAIHGQSINQGKRPPCQFVFLIDTSGSMDAPTKLPRVINGVKRLVDQLSPRDRIAIVAYADADGLVLDSTIATKKSRIRRALDELASGGSTAKGQGIQLAYQIARDHLIDGGINRVIVCTDGNFNGGLNNSNELIDKIKKEAADGIVLTMLGLDTGGRDHSVLDQIDNLAQSNATIVDAQAEANRAFDQLINRPAVTIAKNVTLRIKFNPRRVSEYRLIGFEESIDNQPTSSLPSSPEVASSNRETVSNQFTSDDHVTAIIQWVPKKNRTDDPAKKSPKLKNANKSASQNNTPQNQLLTLTIDYQLAQNDKPSAAEFLLQDKVTDFESADDDMRFAASVCNFGMQLRGSRYAGSWTLKDALAVAQKSVGNDPFGLRREFLLLIRKADQMDASDH